MANLYDPPVKYNLPLSKGSDLYVGFRHKTAVLGDEGEPTGFEETDYPDGATVKLIIEGSPPLTIDATIEGSLATVWAQSNVADAVKAGKLWRAVISYENGLDKVMVNGKVTRSDG